MGNVKSNRLISLILVRGSRKQVESFWSVFKKNEPLMLATGINMRSLFGRQHRIIHIMLEDLKELEKELKQAK